ncbi:MAG TPA: FHA domain-containing protein [Solirubrobacteraceae bacterium]|nr:FHA domain-containing protein [Solirubrobacteraceae bacterium]
MARLRVVSGPNAGQTVDVEQEVVIGREDTDLAIDDDEMSRRHAVVRRHANRLQVEDLGSTNGTFVDGTRIAEPTLLGGGAEIKVGTTVLVVEGVLPVSESSGDIVAPRNATRVSAAIPEGAAPPPPSATPITATAAPVAPPAAPVQAVGEFRPPERSRRQPGLASRSWVPVALSFGTVIIVAIALVIYFSQHS